MDGAARRIFVAGATGATGKRVVALARERGLEVVPHVRPKSAAHAPDGAAVLDLADHAALVGALRGCSTVVQLIGTMRQRFASGDTYETSDIGTTRQLAEAAKEAGIRHFVLLSSVGAGSPRGAYLKAKAEAERLARASGIPCTILRPSAFVGEERMKPGLVVSLFEKVAPAKYKPIRLEELAAAIVQVCADGGPEGVLEGAGLWDVVRRAGAGAA